METLVEQIGNVCVIRVQGRIQAATVKDLETILNTCIRDTYPTIVCNLEGCNFIDSSGLRVLLLALKQMSAEKRDFVLSSLNKYIHDVFHVSGIAKLFEIFDSEQRALAKFDDGNRSV